MSKLVSWMRSLKGKLFVMAGVPAGGLAIVIAISYHGSLGQTEDIVRLATEDLPVSDAIGEMRTAMHATGRFTWRAYGADEDPAERKEAMAEVRRRIEDFNKAMAKFQKLKLPEEAGKMFAPVPDAWQKYTSITDTVLELLAKNKKDSDLEAKRTLPLVFDPGAEIGKALADLNKFFDKRAEESVEDSLRDSTATNRLVLGVGIAAIVAVLAFGMIFASRLSKSLAQVVSQLADSSTQVNQASGQLSSSSQQLSTSATQAAASLEETVSSLEELSSMVSLNADHAKEASSLSQESQNAAVEGEHELQNLIAAMADITRSSKKIEEIISVIDDIAFQTNLLALNAAVEAARAGEQGKGFAVVADAVRSLAGRSATAAKDINALIRESAGKTVEGARVAENSGVVLKRIVTSVKKVADLNQEISAASREQSTGIGQISKAMNQLDQATQSNAASAEEAAAASEELNSQSNALGRLVNELNAVVTGKTNPTS